MNFEKKNITKNNSDYLKSLPSLNEGFIDKFTSVFIKTKNVRLHAVVGGKGPALLLVGGWPQNWYCWRNVMEKLSDKFTIVAADTRGFGLSEVPNQGYDSHSIAEDLVNLMEELGYIEFNMAGFDLGMWSGYAIASEYPQRIKKLAVLDAYLPGVSSWGTLLCDRQTNNFLWHFAFNRAEKVNELLVQGREDIYFRDQFETKSVNTEVFTDEILDYYISFMKNKDNLRAGFDYYRDIDKTIVQNEKRIKRKITIPVLALGGEYGCGIGVGEQMKLVADNVNGKMIEGAGHFLPEESVETVTNELMVFFNY